MTADTTCTKTDGPDLAERYVARTLPPDEASTFEDHFVACADCQRAVRFASAVHAGLRTGALAGATRGSFEARSASVRSWRILIGIGTALAAGIGAIVLMRPTLSADVARLGNVLEPPMYVGVAVRGTPSRADSIFGRAMSRYAERDYAGAAADLRAVLAAGEDSVPAGFFLGASLLMSNNAREAATTFERVLAKGDTPYRDEAQLYEAKALLRLGRGREALSVLARHRPADPVLAGVLLALYDSVTRALAR